MAMLNLKSIGMNKKYILGAVFSFLSTISYADCANHICQNVMVDRLYPNTNGLVYVATSENEKDLNCNSVSGVYLTFNLSEPAGNVYYSTLLAAQLSNKNVSIRVTLESEGCNIQYITIKREEREEGTGVC